MAINPAKSPKARALEQAYQCSIEQVVSEFAPLPHSYEQIAGKWQAKVDERFPDLNLRFSYQDVFAIFRAQGVQRKPRQSSPAQAA